MLGGLQGSGGFTLQNTSGAVALGVGANNSSTTFSGTLAGSGSLAKFGTGTLTLTGSNTYTGLTTIYGPGTLALGNPLALQDSTLDTSTGGTLSFGSLTAATLGGLQGSNSLILQNASSAPVGSAWETTTRARRSGAT